MEPLKKAPLMTEIHLSAHHARFIEKKVAEGQYKDASDAVNDAISVLMEIEKEDEKKLVALRKAIQAGIDSGIAEDFSFEKLNRKLDEELK